MATGDAAGHDHPLREPGNPTAAVHTFLESKLYCSIFNQVKQRNKYPINALSDFACVCVCARNFFLKLFHKTSLPKEFLLTRKY